MSPTAKAELQRLRDFLTEHMEASSSPDFSPEELLSLWREEQPSDEEFEENVAAIQEALDDLHISPGMTEEEFDRHIREKYPELSGRSENIDYMNTNKVK